MKKAEKSAKFKVCDKVTEGSSLISEDTQCPLKCSVQEAEERLFAKNHLDLSSVSTELRHTDGYRHWTIAHTMYAFGARLYKTS